MRTKFRILFYCKRIQISHCLLTEFSPHAYALLAQSTAPLWPLALGLVFFSQIFIFAGLQTHRHYPRAAHACTLLVKTVRKLPAIHFI